LKTYDLPENQMCKNKSYLAHVFFAVCAQQYGSN
jgi:hypothetical protein